MKIVNLITHMNGSGLERDAAILSRLIDGINWKSRFVEYHNAGKCPGADINIFLELYKPEWTKAAPINYLIPNQEWFLSRWLPGLSRLTAVLAKSRHAERIFKAHCPVKYLGFSSEDLSTEIEKSRNFVHFRGRSSTKGTTQLFKAWRDNSGLPPVTVYKYHDRAFSREEKNVLGSGIPGVKVINKRLPKQAFRQAFTSSLFHLCPSPCEGFGHYINEAKACGNIVVTTDASPMNELILDGITGFLVEVSGTEPFHMDHKNYADPSGIARAVRRLSCISQQEIDGVSRAARASYLFGRQSFEERFRKILLHGK